MFDAALYKARRTKLRNCFDGGILLLPGNREVPMNYAENFLPFIQDGTFRYFFGINDPDLVGIIDIDTGDSLLFGPEFGLETLVWSGPQLSLAERATMAGVERFYSYEVLAGWLTDAKRQGSKIHYPPPYRSETILQLADLLDLSPAAVRVGASEALIRAIIPLRERKGPEEIAEMELALGATAEMHVAAMSLSRPGTIEREVVGAMEAVARRRDWHMAYPPIFTRRGEYLHVLRRDQPLVSGDIVVNDSGASSGQGYASDITRTLPIGGRFNTRQRELYQIVLNAQLAAIAAMRPGTSFLDVHKLAAQTQVEGLKQLGLFRGDAEEIVESGAYAICFPCGTGHQIGLDVHDMEALGEEFVGYDHEFKRSPLFGLRRLRMARRLVPGMVITVEPGLYFIPELIAQWRAESRHAQLIDYEKMESFLGFGGIRIEDNVLVTESGARVLGPRIPKAPDEIEALMG